MKSATEKLIFNSLDSLENRQNSVETKLGMVESRLTTVESRLNTVESKLNTLGNGFIDLSRRVFKLEIDIADIKEKVSYIPKLYDMVDKVVTELLSYREERMFINNRLDKHENRITKLESNFSLN
ncbi:hypothetical protein HYV31_01535 [candidate division WWE3 bacterium]|nr:hypothetical protein [candidate division WWE3 bacterium]